MVQKEEEEEEKEEKEEYKEELEKEDKEEEEGKTKLKFVLEGKSRSIWANILFKGEMCGRVCGELVCIVHCTVYSVQ